MIRFYSPPCPWVLGIIITSIPNTRGNYTTTASYHRSEQKTISLKFPPKARWRLAWIAAACAIFIVEMPKDPTHRTFSGILQVCNWFLRRLPGSYGCASHAKHWSLKPVVRYRVQFYCRDRIASLPFLQGYQSIVLTSKASPSCK